MAEKNYYRILELSSAASDEEIKKAYRALAMRYHPDRNQGRERWATNKFKEINEAFSVLGDPGKRRRYDNFGFETSIDENFGGQAPPSNVAGFANQPEKVGIPDLLDDLFAENLRGTGYAFRAFRRGFAGLENAGPGTESGVDLEDLFEQAQSANVSRPTYEIVLSKEQAARGAEKELIRNGKRLRVKIPPGLKAGSKIKLRNALLATDGQPGDIIIGIEVK